jgi:glycosyltransferase involved in cell wall biosynthesis
MRIGIDLSIMHSYEGTQIFAENLVLALVKFYPAQSFIVYKPIGFLPELDKLPQTFPNLKIIILPRVKSGTARLFRQQFQMPFKIAFAKIDVVVSFSPFFSWLAPVKKISTFYDSAYLTFQEFTNPLFKFYLTGSIFMAKLLCARVLTSSEFSKEGLIKEFGFKPKKIQTIFGGSPALPKVTSSEIQSVKRRFNLDNYFINIGITRPRKNLERLLLAFKSIADKGRINLVLVGKIDKTYLDVAAQITKLKLTNRVIQTGFLDNREKVALLSGARALVYPSLYEGFGLPVLEAQSLGMPVLTSKTSSLPEIAGDAAIFVDPFSVADLSQALEQLTFNDELCAQLKEKGLNNIRRFSWGKSAALLMEAVESSK